MRHVHHLPYATVLVLTALLLLALSACMDQDALRTTRHTVRDLQTKYAPDSRVARFTVKVRQDRDTVVLEGETNLPAAKAELLKELTALGIPYRDRLLLLPTKELQGHHWGVVNVSVANLRSNPKHSAELATQALLGTGLRVYKQQADWYLVQTPDRYLGWLEKGAFTLLDETAYRQWQAQAKVIYLPDYGMAYSTTGPAGGRVSDLVAGTILASEGTLAGYRAVLYPDGRRAFIPDGEVADLEQWLEQARASVPDLIRTAYRFVGRPYLWGGTSGKGMDCSGFTKTVYYLNGLVIPRDASQQVHAGIEIPLDTSLQAILPGDLLFFGQAAGGKEAEKIRHVGIYLGDGQFIHSGADNPGVMVQSLRPGDNNYAPHRRESWLRVRRLEHNSPGVHALSELPDFYSFRPKPETEISSD